MDLGVSRSCSRGEKKSTQGTGGKLAHLLQFVEHVGVELAQPQEGKRGAKAESP